MSESIRIRREVINKAINYIFDHWDEPITVEDVARHCNYSKFHLMRLFKEDTEEALYQFIKRLRLERSAFQLKMERDKSITEIGENIGYSSTNYATAFKKQLNQSPSDFRKSAERLAESCAFSHGLSMDDAERREGLITVENIDSFLVVYERRKGNYHNMAREWRDFCRKYEHLKTPETLYVECTIDDPSITDENQCMYELAQTISPDHPALRDSSDLLLHRYEGGKYAVYHFKGRPQFLYMVYQEVFCRWLKRTGNCLDDRPVFDIYRSVAEDDMEIDICFPLK